MEPDATLLQAIARSNDYRRQLLNTDGSLVEIGKAYGVTGRCIGLMVRLSSLSPDVLASILDGTRPVEPTVKRLLKDIPIQWGQHRRELGFLAKA